MAPGLPLAPQIGRNNVHVWVEQASVVDERGDAVVADPVGRRRVAHCSGRVKSAALENGLLHVDLVREIPEAKKPRQIPIGNGQNAQTIETKAAA